MVRFKVEAVQLHWVAADNHVIQSRQSSLTSLTGSWPAPIWSLSPLRLCSLQSQVCWWLAPCFWKSPGSWTMGSCMSCWSWCAKEQPLPDRLWVARDGVSYHIWLPTHCEKPGWWNFDQDQARKWQRALLLRVGAIFTVFGWKLACQRCPLCFPAQDQRWCSADEK